MGKYVEYEDSYKSLKEALLHGGLAHQLKVSINWIEAEGVYGPDWERQLEGYDGILVPGGFGKRGIDGMLNAIRFARENQVPYFGICLGMQTMVIEFARNVCGLEQADSTEFNSGTPHRVIFKLRELKGIDDLGGTMRLGAWPCHLAQGSVAQKAYGALDISERHRHRYEFNREYEERLTAGGLRITGETPDQTYRGNLRDPRAPLDVGLPVPSGVQEQAAGAAPAFQGVYRRGVLLPEPAAGSAGAAGAAGVLWWGRPSACQDFDHGRLAGVGYNSGQRRSLGLRTLGCESRSCLSGHCSQNLVEVFRVDVILPIGTSDAVQSFAKRFPYLIKPFIYDQVFIDDGEGGARSQVLDIHNALVHLHETPEWKGLKEQGCGCTHGHRTILWLTSS